MLLVLLTNSKFNVKVTEPEVYPVQVQGPKSIKVMQTLFGDRILQVKVLLDSRNGS